MENNALITFTMILPIIELCMGIANAVSVKDKIQYPINNPANIHSCDFVPFHAVLNTSDIINLGSIMYNICLLCVDTNVKYIVEKNAGLYIEDKDASEKSFYETIASLMHDKSRLEELQRNSLALAKFDGTEKIVEQLKEIANEKNL